MKNKIYCIFNVLFVVCFSWIFINTFFKDVSVYYKVNPIISFFAFIMVIILWLSLYKIINKLYINLTIKKEVLIVSIVFIIFLLFQVLIYKKLNVEPSWDFGVVFSQAKDYVLTESRLGNLSYPEYFQYFPNNIFLFVIFVLGMKVALFFGITNLHLVCAGINLLFINIALLILYLTIRKIFGKEKALFSLIICLFFTPIFLYTPIFYSDTMSLMFPILIIYLYTFIDKTKIVSKKNILYFIIIGIVTFIGMEIKFTVVIVLIAIFLDLLLSNIKNTLFFTIAIGIIIISILIYNKTIVNNDNFSFKYNDYGSVPYTHWIMMGIEDPESENLKYRNSYGGYQLSDYEYTLSFSNSNESKKHNIEEIKRRINKYGLINYMDYLTKKAVNAWGDGTYFVSVKLGLKPKDSNNNFFQKLFICNREYFYYYVYFAQGVQMSMLLLLIFSSYKSLKEKNDYNYLNVAIFGLMLFLLIWENRSRYLVNYIPIFIFVITQYIEKIKTIRISK